MTSTDPKVRNVAIFHKHMGNAAELEKLGFNISIQVSRLTEKSGKILRNDYREAKRTSNEAALVQVKQLSRAASMPFYKLRAVHLDKCQKLAGYTPPVTPEEKAAAKAKTSDPARETYEKLTRVSYVSPHGGSAKVEVTTPSGEKYIGESFCHIVDMFRGKTALARAYAAVFNKMFEDAKLQETGDTGKGPGKAKLAAYQTVLGAVPAA